MRLDETRSDERWRIGRRQINRKCETQESNISDIIWLVFLLFLGEG